MARLFWAVILLNYTPLQAQECDLVTQHENVGVLSGRRVGDVWCGSPPCCEFPCSNRNGIVLGRRGIGANGGASKSF